MGNIINIEQNKEIQIYEKEKIYTLLRKILQFNKENMTLKKNDIVFCVHEQEKKLYLNNIDDEFVIQHEKEREKLNSKAAIFSTKNK